MQVGKEKLLWMYEKMKVRVAEKGVTLPNSPPAVGASPKGNSGLGIDCVYN